MDQANGFRTRSNPVTTRFIFRLAARAGLVALVVAAGGWMIRGKPASNWASIEVNGDAVTIASYQVKAGDVVQVREKSRKQLRVQHALTVAAQVGFPEWLEVNDKEMRGVFKAAPNRDDVLPDINENLVVELYSK